MIAYLVTLGGGLVLAITSRVALWADLHRAQRLHTEPRVGLLAPALFTFTLSAALVIVGFVGFMHEAEAGQRSPIPLNVVFIVLLACVVALVVSQRLRRRRLSSVRDETRRQIRKSESHDHPPRDDP